MQSSYYLTGYLSVSSNYPPHLKKIYSKYKNNNNFNVDYLLGFIDAIGIFKEDCLILDITHHNYILEYINYKYEKINNNLIKFSNSDYLDFIGNLYNKSVEKLHIDRLLHNINFQFIKTIYNAIEPYKNNYSDVGYNLSIIKLHKVINTNINMYDTGLQFKIPNGYYIEIVQNDSILDFGYVLTNANNIISSNYKDNIYIYLTKINENAIDITYPFNCCKLIIKKQEFCNFNEII